MSLFVGNTDVSKAYIGNTVASAVYVGNTKVWPSKPPAPVYRGFAFVHQPAYSPMPMVLNMPAHQPGDVLIMSFNCYLGANAIVPPTAGGTVPAWTAAYTASNGMALFTARATRADHTSGLWDIGTCWWTCCSSVSGAKAAGSFLGPSLGLTEYDAGAGESPTVPGLTMSRTDGSSLLLTHYYLLGTSSPFGAIASGYTRQGHYGWVANNGFNLSGGSCTKDSSDVDGAFTVGTTANGGRFNAIQMEVLSH